MRNKRIGNRTMKMENSPTIISTASIVGPKEGKGPLKDKFDVIYGYVNIDGYAGKTIKNKINFLTSFRYRPICHQAIYDKNELLKKFPFQLKYKYVADQDWIMKTYASRAKYKYIGIPIANYNLNGFSSTEQGKREGRKEIMEAKSNAFPLQCALIQLFKK